MIDLEKLTAGFWTNTHFVQLLSCEIAMIIIAIILNKFLGKKPLKVRMIPYQILTVILLLSEVGKQYLSFQRGYNLYHIPLHVCSLFLVLTPFMSFYNGKYKDVMRSVTCAVTMSLILFMVVYPNLIYSADNIKHFFTGSYFDFHTVFYHNVVIFQFILIIALRLHHIDHSKRNLKGIALFALAFSAAAGIMSQVLKTNYAKFYYCDAIGIGALVDQLKGVIGEVAGQTIYVIFWSIFHVLFFILAYYIYRGVDMLNIKFRGRAENQN